MNLDLIPYREYEHGLPQEGNFILGQQHNDTIIVYQAFNHRIADYAVVNQKFGGPDYSLSRMTWIKPNFLWMMYRSGWAQKENQERILAIEMTFNAFTWMLKFGTLTSYDPKVGSHEEWKKQLDESDVRIQWDPDHGLNGEKLKRRAVQIGMKDEALKRFHDSIESITDITSFVQQQHKLIHTHPDEVKVVFESVVEINERLRTRFDIPSNVHSVVLESIINEVATTGTISKEVVESFLFEGELREELIKFIRNKQHIAFSRILLKTATELRRDEMLPIMCDDLLLFAWLVSKNKEVEDLKLVVDAKLVDFDCWCGFDGAMVFNVLGFEETMEYLKNNRDKHPEANLEHLLGFSRKEVDEYKSDGAFWYLF